jgi:O-antigen/teichoic acid export membrane protein
MINKPEASPLRCGLKLFWFSAIIKDLGWSSAAAVAIKIVGFIQLAVISNIVGVQWYGAWALVHVLIAYSNQVTTLSLPNAVVKFFPEERRSDSPFLCLLSVVFVFSVAVAIAVWFLAGHFAAIFLKDEMFASLLRCGALLIPLNSIKLMVQDYFRARNNIRGFSLIQGGVPILEMVVLTIVLTLKRDLVIALQGILVLSFAVTVGLVYKVIRASDLRAVFIRNTRSRLVYYFRYSIPLVPTAFSMMIASSGDRFIVGYLLGAESVGLYGGAYALASAIMLLNPPFTNVLFPRVTRLYADNKASAVRFYIRKGMMTFLGAGCLVLLLFIAMGRTLLGLLVGTEISNFAGHDGVVILLIVAVALLIYGASRIYSLHLFLLQRTRSLLVIYFVGALSNSILAYVLTAGLGLVGTALSTLAGYILISAFLWRSIYVGYRES